jgi:hypothetical protein
MTMTTDFNAEWAAAKADYAELEAAQERAAYEAKAARDEELELPLWKGGIDRWTLDRFREGKQFRDENPSTTPEGIAEDAELDRWLAIAERTYALRGANASVPAPAEEQARPASGNGNGAVGSGPARNAPTDAQLRFIASLGRDLGRELETPRDKSHASLIIDGAKKELAKARAAGAVPADAVPVRRATEKQVEFLANLLVERAHDLGELDPAELSAARASELITALMGAPRAKVAAHGIAEGRYAFTPDGGTTADHYRVTRTGRIVVWTAGGEWPYNGKLNEGLEWIKANQREAAALFGRLTETCGRCGRPLSDDNSRAIGLGPVCAGKAW